MDTTTQAPESSSAIAVSQAPNTTTRNNGKRPAVDDLDDNHSIRQGNKRDNINRVFADRPVPPITAEEVTGPAGPIVRENDLSAELERTIAKLEKAVAELQAEKQKTARLREEKTNAEKNLEDVYKHIRAGNARSQETGAARNKGYEDTITRLRGERNDARNRADQNHFTLLRERAKFEEAYTSLDKNNTLLYNAHQALLANGGREGYIAEQRALEMVEQARFELRHDLQLQHKREATKQIKLECDKARAEAVERVKEEAARQIKIEREEAVKETKRMAEELFLEEQMNAEFALQEEVTAKEAALKQVEELQKELKNAGTKIVEVPAEVMVEKVVYVDRPVPEMVCSSMQTIELPSSSSPMIAIGGVQEISRPLGAMVCTSTQTIEPLSSDPLTITIGGVQETPEEYPPIDERLEEMTASYQTEVAELQALLSESQEKIAKAEESASQLVENHGKELITIDSAHNNEIARLSSLLALAEAPKTPAEMLKLGYVPIPKDFHGMKKSNLLKNCMDKHKIFLPLSDEEYKLKQAKAAKREKGELRKKIQSEVDAHYHWLIDFKYEVYNDSAPPPPPTKPYEEFLDAQTDLRKQKRLVAAGERRQSTLQEELDAAEKREEAERKRAARLEAESKARGVLETISVVFAVTMSLTTIAKGLNWLIAAS